MSLRKLRQQLELEPRLRNSVAGRLRTGYGDWRSRRYCLRQLKFIEKEYEPKLSSLQEEAHRKAWDEYNYALHFPLTKLLLIESGKLIRQAIRLGIEVPSEKEAADWWERDREMRLLYLSDIGKTKLNKLIRTEQWAIRQSRATVISTLTGLIGALIGLLALLKK